MTAWGSPGCRPWYVHWRTGAGGLSPVSLQLWRPAAVLPAQDDCSTSYCFFSLSEVHSLADAAFNVRKWVCLLLQNETFTHSERNLLFSVYDVMISNSLSNLDHTQFYCSFCCWICIKNINVNGYFLSIDWLKSKVFDWCNDEWWKCTSFHHQPKVWHYTDRWSVAVCKAMLPAVVAICSPQNLGGGVLLYSIYWSIVFTVILSRPWGSCGSCVSWWFRSQWMQPILTKVEMNMSVTKTFSMLPSVK